MRRVTPDHPWPLHDAAATRRLEQAAAAGLPPHSLMDRAGLAVARLALALAPHARDVWIACGPGNNGGDGLEAAVHLHRWGKRVHLTLAGAPERLPPDAANALRRASAAGIAAQSSLPSHWDLCIDALLGLGARPLDGALAAAAGHMAASPAPVLSIDLPSGLAADTGAGESVRATATLTLLSLKPGLFTHAGRDTAGDVWFDELGIDTSTEPPTALLLGPPAPPERPHASHKGSYGDVAVIGGAPGMAGAAVLAAQGALHAGAGRVYLAPLDPQAATLVAGQPELMVRDAAKLPLDQLAVACGCGGGEAVAAVLPETLAGSARLVVDADALNAIAADATLQALLRQRGDRPTVLTPHPLEAARLLACKTADVQADRLDAARRLADRFSCVVVLKGSGSVIAAPARTPAINPTGSARLATGGTGDVLAGLVAARLAAGLDSFSAACAAVFQHGQVADRWPVDEPLTAGALARKLRP